jgi:hypothetical protein
MSRNVTYTFYAEIGGEPALNLTPSFSVFMAVGDSSSFETIPVITEIGSGFYKYEFEWVDGDLNSYLTKVDLGISVPPGERYIINRIERHDFLPDTAASIEASAELIKTKADSLIASAGLLEELVVRLLDIEEGNWEINNNKLVIKDAAGVKITEFNLFGSTGIPTSSNPYKRELTYQKPRPSL